MVRVAFLASNLPKNQWGEVVYAIVYVKNRLVHSTTSAMPYKAFVGRKPTIGHLQAIGEIGYAHIPIEARPPGLKLEARAKEMKICKFGMSDGIYRVYVSAKQQVFIS